MKTTATQTLRGLLDAVRDGSMSVDEAVSHMAAVQPADSLGYARPDYLRAERTGFGEVIFCPGKTDEQVAEIAYALAQRSPVVMATRATESAFIAVRTRLPAATFSADARIIAYEKTPLPRVGLVAVVSAGTSDGPVAAEAAACLDLMGNRVARLDDVGVAGLHRVLGHVGGLRVANVVVVVAGMDGALPAVVAGLTDKPVVAVPTSVGYGAAFQGLAALLAMLNACPGGVGVVNIDGGFGAACAASRINHAVATAKAG
ncbi:MAG: nickel pincer cofactor biosynthesis protein LarB [Candidatus Eremiobacteraeota bacterium]|nr:nickel pincer cofactor biosynthesis protein LarB [Candidatus Eremiobacteraeota bacterium]